MNAPSPDKHGEACTTRFPISECQNMKAVEGDTSMTHEHYACAVCGRRESLDYEEMK